MRPERFLLTFDIDRIFRHAIAILQLLLDDLQALRILLPGEGGEDTPVLALSHDPTFRIIGWPICGGNFIAAWGRTHCHCHPRVILLFTVECTQSARSMD